MSKKKQLLGGLPWHYDFGDYYYRAECGCSYSALKLPAWDHDGFMPGREVQICTDTQCDNAPDGDYILAYASECRSVQAASKYVRAHQERHTDTLLRHDGSGKMPEHVKPLFRIG